MHIQINLTIPPWTKWVTAGVLVGVVLGAGASRVYADAVAVKTDWKPSDLLTADALNANFKRLEDEINRLKHPDCPEDYVPSGAVNGVAGTMLCKRGVDEMVRVGSGGAAFWIDRYEATVWDSVDGREPQYGLNANDPYSKGPQVNGQPPPPAGTSWVPVYALSVPGKPPSAYITWFQAQQACAASGKRLPNGEEWLRAATGTEDPTTDSPGTDGACVTKASGPRPTGSVANATKFCRSHWGAEDMIGNLWEWTADWYAAPGSATGADAAFRPWNSGYNSDGTIGIVSSAIDGVGAYPGVPAAGVRGGWREHGSSAGIFALAVTEAPSNRTHYVGFRCVVSR